MENFLPTSHKQAGLLFCKKHLVYLMSAKADIAQILHSLDLEGKSISCYIIIR